MFKGTRIGSQIAGGFALAVALMIATGTIAYLNSEDLGDRLDYMTGTQVHKVDALGRIGAALPLVMRGVNGLLAEPIQGDARRGSHAVVAQGLERLQTAMDDYAKLGRSAGMEKRWRPAAAAIDEFRSKLSPVVAAISRCEVGEGERLDESLVRSDRNLRDSLVRLNAAYDEAERTTQAVLDLTHKNALTRHADGRAAKSRANLEIAMAIAAGAALLALLGWRLGKKIGRVTATLKSEAARLRDSVARGELRFRGEPDRLDAEFRPVVEGMNEVMDAYAKPIAMVEETLVRISRGDIPGKIAEHYQGDFDEIKQALNRCVDAVGLLVQDSRSLASAAVEGRLSTRADASRHQGDFKKVVEGVNASLDAVLAPLEFASQAVERISRGDIPEPIAEAWAGDFGSLRDSLNQCISAVNALVADAKGLAQAAAEGRLAARADASRHQGDFRRIVRGVNETLDSMTGPLRTAAAAVDRISRGDIPPSITEPWAGDFAPLRDNLNQCIAAVSALVAEAAALARAAEEGRLATRADASRHQGDFRRIVEGVNRGLDVVLAPIQEAAQVLERLACRDLRVRVSGNYAGDHARMKTCINAAAEALHDALSQVAEVAEQVSSAAQQIASSSQAVASGASEQAASLEETHSSLESMASQTGHAADSAAEANGLSSITRTSAKEGATAMKVMTGAMAKIRASAEGTSAIIKDISAIAFQTNLLALNAAVEAARAGEAGRGFAVVAEEVRSLASRAKEAAVRTEQLIQESVHQAGEGEQIAQRAAGKLSEIVGSVEKVSAIIAEIAGSAREQAAGIDQVNRAVGEMDRVTQQNAASSEESSSAAAELNRQAEDLTTMVGTFQLHYERLDAAGVQPEPVAPPATFGPQKSPKPERRSAPAPKGAPRPADVIPLDGEICESRFKNF